MPCLYGLRGGQKTTNHRLTERSVDWRRFLICWYLLKTGDFGYLFLAYKKPSLFVDDTQSMNSSIPRPLWSSDRCMCCVQSRTLLANLLCNELLGVAGKWRGEWNTKKKSLLIEWYYRRYSSLTMCHYKLAFHTLAVDRVITGNHSPYLFSVTFFPWNLRFFRATRHPPEVAGFHSCRSRLWQKIRRNWVKFVGTRSTTTPTKFKLVKYHNSFGFGEITYWKQNLDL